MADEGRGVSSDDLGDCCSVQAELRGTTDDEAWCPCRLSGRTPSCAHVLLSDERCDVCGEFVASGRTATCLNCLGDREDAPRPWCAAHDQHDVDPGCSHAAEGRSATCRVSSWPDEGGGPDVRYCDEHLRWYADCQVTTPARVTSSDGGPADA